MIEKSIESMRCAEYIASTVSEIPFSRWIEEYDGDITVIVTQGFEERSIGFIEGLAEQGLTADAVIIGRHSSHIEANAKYHARFEAAAVRVSRDPLRIIDLDVNGLWVSKALLYTRTSNVVLDITGIGTRGLFGALDAAAHSDKRVLISYTEAKEYWPKRADWATLKSELADVSSLPDAVDNKPWLFGYEHNVELIPGHEGYDSAGMERALIGLLPFKYARLAAVMSAEDYASFLFIAGRPRLPENAWRYEALLDINRDIVKDRRIVEMSTFGYRMALQKLHDILLQEDSLLEQYDVHVALMGSKLQDVACWALSCMIPSLTVLTAVPTKYYHEAFSEGVGQKWVFPLVSPYARK